MASSGKTGRTQRKYPSELKERGVRLVRETIEAQGGERHGVVARVAGQLGVGVESLRYWVRQADMDAGARPGVSTEERRRIAELEKEVKELRRANEILRASAIFFARELDPRAPK